MMLRNYARGASLATAETPGEHRQFRAHFALLGFRADLDRELQREIITARRVAAVLALLIDVTDESQTFDLPPGILAADEITEGRHREILRAAELSTGAQRRREIQAGHRRQLEVLELTAQAKRLLEQRHSPLAVPVVERQAAEVVQRDRLTADVAGFLEVGQRRAECPFRGRELAHLRQDRPEVLQRDSADARDRR